jgi:hypothetical protein
LYTRNQALDPITVNQTEFCLIAAFSKGRSVIAETLDVKQIDRWEIVTSVMRSVLMVFRNVTHLCLVFALVAPLFAQRSIEDLDPNHAETLRRYLATHKNVSFRAESVLSEKYLSSIRETMGSSFRPNYAVGDFNGDKRKDFALLLNRDGRRVASGATSVEHKWDHPLRLVVFNGTAAGFDLVLTQDLIGPFPALITYTGKRLHYGVFETDSDDFYLKPVGKRYVIRPEPLQ